MSDLPTVVGEETGTSRGGYEEKKEQETERDPFYLWCYLGI
jgi:hypothetical protein